MRSLAIFCGLFCLAAGLTAEPAIPRPRGYVNDFAGALDAAFEAKLDSALAAANRRGGPQVAVVLVDQVPDGDLEGYSNELFNRWKIGRKGKDDGLLMLLALKDRRLRIEVGRGLEGDIPDGWAGRLRDEVIVPRLKQGNLPAALWAGCDGLLRKAGDPGLEGAGAGNVLPPQAPPGMVGLVLGLVFIAFMIAISRGLGRRRRGIWYGGGWGGGFGGGFGGGGFGGSGGGFGGFGGGSSGGGGVSGGW